MGYETLVCKNCGKEFKRQSSEIANYKKRGLINSFCSTRCCGDYRKQEVTVELLLSRTVENPVTGCKEWQGGLYGKNGYGTIKQHQKKYLTHRLMWELIHGPITDSKLYVCHHCDNRRCINPEHLFLGTQSENMLDASRKGRIFIPQGIKFKKGNIPHNRPLTDEIAREIKKQIKDGAQIKTIAENFKVSRYVVSDIKRGRSYKYVV